MPILIRASLSFVILASVIVLLSLLLFIAPRVDESAGFLAVRAMKAVQSYKVNGVPVRGLVDSEIQGAHWRAYHQDTPFQTFVECSGTGRRGGVRRRMIWYVEERPRWNSGPSLKIITMTALNRDALKLTPSLFDPRAGYGLDQRRHGVELP